MTEGYRKLGTHSFRVDLPLIKILVDIEAYLKEQGEVDQQPSMSEVIRRALIDYYFEVIKPMREQESVPTGRIGRFNDSSRFSNSDFQYP